MRKLFALLLIVCVGTPLLGQELNCTCTINSTQITTSDRGIFRDMKSAIEQFMNSRKWSGDAYKSHEKIKCNLLMTITKMPSVGNFSASLQIQSARPVFNTNYSSLTFNFADRDFEFEYIESLPMEYNDNTFTTNLTSMLAVYAYLMIGVDSDSFAELGGTPYFQKALAVVNNAQQSNRAGWEPMNSNRSRYWIVENYNNGQMTEMRKSFYSYHRLGLDTFEKDPDKSREVIVKGLREVKKVRDVNPTSILVVSFFDAKSKELANLFSTGNVQVRREAYDIITAIDPSNRTAYEKMIKN
ncbi:DUF4835 family protein [Chryseolinea sp. T2]|uniref:type IX secretion system protein PorD n=1 Tax=Chryseolinea sp. T2 TaxID=3129255 RepID=UPI0030785D4F